MGLSAGSLSHSLLGWVRNIRRDKKNTSRHQQINTNVSSAFAVLWNLVRALLLPKIVKDFDAWLENIGLKYHMDGDRTMGTGGGLGKYHIKLGEGKPWYEFNNAHLAPPAGVMAENYCRCVLCLLNNDSTRYIYKFPPGAQTSGLPTSSTNPTSGVYRLLRHTHLTIGCRKRIEGEISLFTPTAFTFKQPRILLSPGGRLTGMVQACPISTHSRRQV